jgi:calcium-dependent protein kinase
MPEWDPISESAKDLVSNMLNRNREERYSIEEVLKHTWIENREKNEACGILSAVKSLSNVVNYRASKKLE